MPRLRPVHWKKLECVFIKFGFKYQRRSSNHKYYIKPGCNRPITIPLYKEIGIDIIKNNMRTAGMSRDDYFRLLQDC